MLAGEPVMVTWRSVDPSTGLAILIWAPDICLISLILAPWRPIMQPMSCIGEEQRCLRGSNNIASAAMWPCAVSQQQETIWYKGQNASFTAQSPHTAQFWHYSQQHSLSVHRIIGLAATLTSFGMVISWEQAWAEASIPGNMKIKCTAEIQLSMCADEMQLLSQPPRPVRSYSTRIITKMRSSYQWIPGCMLPWEMGPAAWPVGEACWAVGR